MSIPKRVFLKFRSITCVLTIIFAYLSNVTTLRLNDPFQSRNCKPKSPPDFDSVDIYPQLNFTASWTTWGKGKHFWTSKDFDFEERYVNENPENSTVKPSQVQVFVLPYSHNDPGWLQTFEGYFYSKTKQIINNAVIKLSSYENMTFAWSEISFLSKWWDEASTPQKDVLKKHVKEGRFEILTGGWVMSDESCSSLLGLLHQLVEGHQWIKQHLKVTPTAAWSIDPFGHGSTMPYILKAAGIDIMVIQRIHYAWKHWLAEHRKGDFKWIPRWSSDPKNAILCHNAHYDLYPTKHSCGPQPNVCMQFDFRRIEGKREEQWAYMTPVDNQNLPRLASALNDQYRRTASLTLHNKVFTALGGDFRFEEPLEWDQQYSNYQKLMDYINHRPQQYHSTVKFGTLGQYFNAVTSTKSHFPTFSGDFLPYSDIIFAHAPAYWTGFYGTRPFWKKLIREAEDELRKAEIIFTFSYNLLRQRNHSDDSIEQNYDNLVQARRSIALFQHHDGITGTSPRLTMLDYSKKLTQAWNFLKQIQKLGIEAIWKHELKMDIPPLTEETSRKSYTNIGHKNPIKLYENTSVVKKVLLYNSLGWKTLRLVRLVVETSNVTVKGPEGEYILSQINPIMDSGHHNPTNKSQELVFLAKLPPLSVVTYEISQQDGSDVTSANMAKINCTNCNHFGNGFESQRITLENQRILAIFNSSTGMLQELENKLHKAYSNVTLSFGKYHPCVGSGAYLLRICDSSEDWILDKDKHKSQIILHSGPVMSQLSLISGRLKFSTWIINANDSEMSSSLFMKNEVSSSKSEYGEFFVRFQTDLINTQPGESEKPSPVLFTDTNGFAVEKRVTVSSLPYQANHYPMTHYAFIQDNSKKLRFTVLVDRTHGVSSMNSGQLEMIFDRVLQRDDGRGLGEGVHDSETAVSYYAVKLESTRAFNAVKEDYHSWEPTLAIQRTSKYLNHPPTIFTYDAMKGDRNGNFTVFTSDFPEDTFLISLRTLSGVSETIKSVPSSSALMTVHRMGHITSDSCSNGPSHSVKLNTALQLSHDLRKANLVGTLEDKDNLFQANNTRYLYLEKFYEMYSYFVDM